KIYLAKCLETNNWDDIKRDINNRPIEGVSDTNSKIDILSILEKHGVKKSNDDKTSTVQVEILGSGKPMREFLWSEEMADACVYIMENVDFKDLINYKANIKQPNEIRNTHINIGTGKEISISDLAKLIKNVVGYKGAFVFNNTKPDGTIKKLTDVTKLHQLGWKHSIEIESGVQKIYEWYISSLD
ncbi:MAG: hypothetical protein C0591_15085, partial [Marinilabiliales bacterium]